MSWTDQDHRRLSNSSGADDGVVTRAASARSYPHQCTRLRLFGQSCIYISTTKLVWKKSCGRNSIKILFEIELYKEWDEYRSHVAKTCPKYDVSEWFCLRSCAGVKRVVGGARCQNIPKTWCISNQAWHSAQSSDGPTRIIIQVSHCWNLDLHFEKLHQNKTSMCRIYTFIKGQKFRKNTNQWVLDSVLQRLSSLT